MVKSSLFPPQSQRTDTKPAHSPPSFQLQTSTSAKGRASCPDSKHNPDAKGQGREDTHEAAKQNPTQTTPGRPKPNSYRRDEPGSLPTPSRIPPTPNPSETPGPWLQAVELEASVHARGGDELGVVAKSHSRGEATVLWGGKRPRVWDQAALDPAHPPWRVQREGPMGAGEGVPSSSCPAVVPPHRLTCEVEDLSPLLADVDLHIRPAQRQVGTALVKDERLHLWTRRGKRLPSSSGSSKGLFGGAGRGHHLPRMLLQSRASPELVGTGSGGCSAPNQGAAPTSKLFSSCKVLKFLSLRRSQSLTEESSAAVAR